MTSGAPVSVLRPQAELLTEGIRLCLRMRPVLPRMPKLSVSMYYNCNIVSEAGLTEVSQQCKC